MNPTEDSSILIASSMFDGTIAVLMAGASPPPSLIDCVFDIYVIKWVRHFPGSIRLTPAIGTP
jgi:hypothetical protein